MTKRTKVVSIRFTGEEFADLYQKAQEKHISVSDYLRQRLNYEPLNYRPFTITSSQSISYNTPRTTSSSIMLPLIPSPIIILSENDT